MSDSFPRIDSASEQLITVFHRLKSAAGDTILPLVITHHCDAVDCQAWLAGQNDLPRIYWKSRDDGREIAAAGVAILRITESPAAAALQAQRMIAAADQDELLCMVGGRFMGTNAKDDRWRSFPSGMVLVPKTILRREGDNYFFQRIIPIRSTTTLDQIKPALGETINLSSRAESPVANFVHLIKKQDLPDQNFWRDLLLAALGKISEGVFDKVVMARATEYGFDQQTKPLDLFNTLCRQHRSSYQLYFEASPDLAFYTVSPERLFCRQDHTIRIDAVSSTVIRGQTEEEDRLLAKYLMQSSKERREHQYVIDSVSRRLTALFDRQPHIQDTDILKLDQVQHLYTRLSLPVTASISDADVLRVLHPTPAVGGSPRDAALAFIAEYEPFDRGWYAAPFGIMSKTWAEFAVGIRSLLHDRDHLIAFTGAGIVAGSEPDAEWRELEAKNVVARMVSPLDVG